jgi:MoxR-like ATPase
MQFTPDVMPADILGFSMYQKDTGRFEYKAGPIMCNLFLADEINRTSPKSQSALLEVMEEGVVTVDGISHSVPAPFIVMATQNPKGSAGTQLLPESQLDRFMICMSMGYPDMKSEIEIAKGKSIKREIEQVRAILNPETLLQMQQAVESVFVHEHVYTYMCKLVQETRENPYLELGISPRGTLALVRMAKAWAMLQGRTYVTPDDVYQVFTDIGKHRIVLNTKARVSHVTEEAVLNQVLSEVRQPATYMETKEYRG